LQLLQRQRDKKESVALGLAEFNVNKLVAQLNKSELFSILAPSCS